MICVYKITCLNPEIKWCYIGSTKNYSTRKSNHKTDCYNKKNLKYNKKAYCFIRANNGFDNFKFEIIEEFEEYDKIKLRERELYYIDKTWNTNANIHRPYSKYDNKKKRANGYYKNNKEKILQKQKEYRENNKEIISQKQKEHYENNKEKLLQKKKEYRENNKEIISLKCKIKINCNFCNRLSSKDSMKRHQRTKFCLNIQSNLKK